MSTDKAIRQKVKEKDYEHVERMKKEMEEQEKQLKKFFAEDKKATGVDPTLRRKSKYDHKLDTLKDAMKDFTIFGFYNSFWKYKPLTPEQDETLNSCKKFVMKSLLTSSSVGMLVTTGVNYYYRAYLPLSVKLFGLVIGCVGGGMYGLIRSTQFVLKNLEELGPDYPLGRLVVNQIQDYRMDKAKPNGSQE